MGQSSLVINIQDVRRNLPKDKVKEYVKALNAADNQECGDPDLNYDGEINQDCEITSAATNISGEKYADVKKAEDYLRKVLGLDLMFTDQKYEGTDMFGNPEFNLVQGKVYGYGAEVVVKGEKLFVDYKSDAESGVVHTYDGGDWNGKPISLEKYSKMTIVVDVVEGDMANTKFEINDRIILDFGDLRPGVNTIDLTKLKKHKVPLTEIKKINFVNKNGTTGKYWMRIILE